MKKRFSIFLAGALGAAAGGTGVGYFMGREIKKREEKVDKFKIYYNLLNQWLLLKNTNISVADYFIKNNYKKIAIYGMGELGNRLIEELALKNIKVAYGIDKNAEMTYSEIEVLDIEDNLPDVDIIVVTAVFAFDKIEKLLGEITDAQIVSLEEIVFDN